MHSASQNVALEFGSQILSFQMLLLAVTSAAKPRGILPYFTRQNVLLNKVSFCGKNHATGYCNWQGNYATGYHVERKIMQQGITSKNSVSTLFLRREIFMRQGIPLAHFYATGCRERKGFPHTPVMFLVKYPSPLGRSIDRKNE